MPDAIVIDPEDDVATLLQASERGQDVVVKTGDERAHLRAREAIPESHKIALRDIARGTVIKKYGYAIGRAERDVRKGEHVHTHNMGALDE